MKRLAIILPLFAAACSPEPPPLDGPDFAAQCQQPVAQSASVEDRSIEGIAVTSDGAGYVNVRHRHTSKVWQCATNPSGTIIRSETTYPGQ